MEHLRHTKPAIPRMREVDALALREEGNSRRRRRRTRSDRTSRASCPQRLPKIRETRLQLLRNARAAKRLRRLTIISRISANIFGLAPRPMECATNQSIRSPKGFEPARYAQVCQSAEERADDERAAITTIPTIPFWRPGVHHLLVQDNTCDKEANIYYQEEDS